MGRPITVEIGPLASADADGIATSQTAVVVGGQYLVLNGALTDGQTANNVCASQTPSGAGNLLINGTLASGGVAYLGQNSRIYIASGSNISSRTFTILGLVQTAGGLVAQTETLTGPNNNRVASQKLYYSITSIAISGSAAGAITVGRAGTATLTRAGRVAITSGGNDTGITFTITGTDVTGTTISEALTGASGAAATSVLSYATVTSVLTSGAAASTVEVGSSAVADSPWVFFDDYGANSQVSIQVEVSGTVSGTVSQTMDNPNIQANPMPPNPPIPSIWTPATVQWVNHPDAALVNFSGTVQGNYAYAPAMARVTLNSGTGSIRATFRQAYQS